jgi:hypothetical protein
MEMKYMKVPMGFQDQPVAASSSFFPDAEDDSSPRRSSPVWILRRIFGVMNSYLQITSPGYQHGPSERKLSFFVFMFMFICFICTSLFVFTGGDQCSSHQQGLERLRAERDHLQAELALLRGAVPTPTQEMSGEKPVSVIP